MAAAATRVAHLLLQLLLHHPGLLRLILHHENANGVAVAVIVHHADDEQGEAMLIGLIGGIHPHNGVAIELEHAELVWCLMHQQKKVCYCHPCVGGSSSYPPLPCAPPPNG